MDIPPPHTAEPPFRALFEAAGDDGLWRGALRAGARWLDATEIHYFVIDKRSGSVRFNATAGHVADEAAEVYFRDWASADPRRDRAQAAAVGELIACHRHFDADFVRHDPFYNEFLIPLGLRWAVAAKLLDTPDVLAIAGILRPPEALPFEGADLARVGTFIEALSRAAALHQRFGALRDELAQAQSLADGMGTGLLVVEGDGRILALNAAADRILGRGDGFRAPAGRLRAIDAATQPTLSVAIASAAAFAGDGAGGEARGVLVPRANADEPYRAGVWPLGAGAALRAGDGSPRVLLSIADPERPSRPAVPAFSTMYRLTAAEAMLVEHLAAGEPLADIAERRRVRISTLRSQLSTVLAKTGVRRQGDVIRLLSEWPPVQRAAP